MRTSRFRRTIVLLVMVAIAAVGLAACAPAPSLLPKAAGRHAAHDDIPVRVVTGPDHQALLVARVRIDGKGPFPFLVDTGAAISVVNAPLAAELHLAVVKRQSGRLQGAGCTTSSGEDRVSRWRVDHIVLPPIDVSTVTMSSSTSSSAVQGLLGSDLWDQFASLDIDYARSLVRIDTVSSGRSVAVRVVHADGEVVVVASVDIGGRGPYPFVVDTGASDTVVSRDLDRTFHFHQITRAVTVAAVGCSSKASLVRVRHWSTGGVSLPAGAALDLKDPLGTSNAGPIGILGSSALSRFGQITIEYARQRLILASRSPATDVQKPAE